MVRLKFGHFGHNAVGQLENQRLLGVQRLPFPLASDPFENQHMIAGCGHCKDLDAQRAFGLMSELTEELQNGLNTSIVSPQNTSFSLIPVRVG